MATPAETTDITPLRATSRAEAMGALGREVTLDI
jgi:hypothetical protein